MAENKDFQIEEIEGDPLAHLDESPLVRHTEAGGCFSIWGPIGVCWELQGGKVKVCLKLGPVSGPCGFLDPATGCVKLEQSVICAKASIQVCLEGNCLVYKGEACYRDAPCVGKPWKCSKVQGKIICF
jgi:hypothetical protein